MSSVADLARPEIRELKPYRAASFADGLVRLNANESPWGPPGDETPGGLNRYPDSPVELTARMAENYGVPADRLLVTRGSSEAIDLLIRCFCRAGQDDIVICPPTFGMYGVYAQLQGAGIREVPLLREDGFALDLDGILGAWDERCKLLFICSPNNPTGNRIPTEQIDTLCTELRGKGIVVVDAAYAEFADEDPTLGLLERHDNVAVLRTLSKALGLAGIRCGAVLAAEPVIDLVSCVMPPHAYPSPSLEAALVCLDPALKDEFQSRVERLRNERDRLTERLAALTGVKRVWPSEANFLLIEVSDPAAFVASAKSGGVLIRDFSWDPYATNCLRITVGDEQQNNQLLDALGNYAE
jgi:histidinol-phosphate aminotransferase